MVKKLWKEEEPPILTTLRNEYKTKKLKQIKQKLKETKKKKFQCRINCHVKNRPEETLC